MKPSSVIVAFVALCASIGVISWLSRPGVSDHSIEEGEGDEPVEVKENPFAISQSGPHPVVVVDEESYDFGTMLLHKKASHTFVIRNEGEAPLKLELKKKTCKCTIPTIPDGEVPPGRSVKVTLDWETLHLSEEYSQAAILWTNDPERKELMLQIKGKVFPVISVKPPFPWTIGTIKESGPSTFSGLILSGQETFEVLSIESTQDWLTAEVEPLTTEELKSFGNSLASGYRVIGTVRPEMEIGRFEETLNIQTDLEDSETLSGPIIGARAGSFSIIGRSWHGSEMTVRMGDIAADEGKSLSLSLFTARQEEPLKMESVSAVPDIVDVSLERDDSFQTPVKEKYDLQFTIPPQARKGRFADENSIRVTITTNRAEMDVIHLSVDANIQ